MLQRYFQPPNKSTILQISLHEEVQGQYFYPRV